MAALAQRLPVLFIPEESRIAPVRNDVVHDRGWRDDALRQAVCAQGMALQEALPCPAPFGVIAAFGGAATQTVWRLGAVLRAVCAALAQVGAVLIAHPMELLEKFNL